MSEWFWRILYIWGIRFLFIGTICFLAFWTVILFWIYLDILSDD